MKAIPHNPQAMQPRIIQALCDDLFDIGSGKTTRFDRVNAIHEINRQSFSRDGSAAEEAAPAQFNGTL
jgi:hypothetical protein